MHNPLDRPGLGRQLEKGNENRPERPQDDSKSITNKSNIGPGFVGVVVVGGDGGGGGGLGAPRFPVVRTARILRAIYCKALEF